MPDDAPSPSLNVVVSVSDPANLELLGRALAEMGASIYATGGTKARLDSAGIQARSISDLTHFPEILGGRIKTLHPAVHSGILARRDDPAQMKELARHGLREIALVAVNLYPFAETIKREGVTLADALEQIDIGGPTMLRAAAKNYPSVVVLSDPADYEPVISEWRDNGEVSQETRRRLAAKAFRHVSGYDAVVAEYLGDRKGTAGAELFPLKLAIGLRRVQLLRYGENPHQEGALYSDNLPVEGPTLVGSLEQIKGPALSYNNMLDADAAIALARDYNVPAVAIIKHAGPCGLACGADDGELPEIFARALASDPQSAFGGIVGVNRPVDDALAEQIAKTRFDLIVAPGFSEGAVDLLSRRRNLRLLAVPDSDTKQRDDEFASRLAFRQISGGFLVQSRDSVEQDIVMEPVTLRHPTLEEIADLTFAWRAVKHVRSNAIVLARRLATVGIGAGQASRVDSVKIAAEKAGMRARGAVMASDAFFPFPDAVEVAASAGVTAIIQPGGSVNDDASIEAADVAGVSMVFTRRRHFRH